MSDDWQKVADNARRSARYEDADAMQRFQDALATAEPVTPEDFNKACLPHHLTGESIDPGILPSHLTRVVDKGHIDAALRRMAGGYALPVHRPLSVPEHEWTTLDQILAVHDVDREPFFPARVIDDARPTERAVFATFDEADEPPTPAPRPRFYDRIIDNHSPNESAADYAVWCLATESRPRAPTDVSVKILLHYPRDSVMPCRFPVPADAGCHARFRAILPGNPCHCGRTFPEGSGVADHDGGRCGENEVVHRNNGLPCSDVYVRSIGETTCAPR